MKDGFCVLRSRTRLKENVPRADGLNVPKASNQTSSVLNFQAVQQRVARAVDCEYILLRASVIGSLPTDDHGTRGEVEEKEEKL